MQGLIGVATANGAAALVEVNCETDFVARSDQFMRLPRAIAAQALQCSQDRAAGAAGAVEVPLEELSACALEGGAMVCKPSLLAAHRQGAQRDAWGLPPAARTWMACRHAALHHLPLRRGPELRRWEPCAAAR